MGVVCGPPERRHERSAGLPELPCEKGIDLKKFVVAVGAPSSMRTEVRTDVPALTMMLPHRFLAHARCQHHYPSLTAVGRVVCSQQ